MGIIYRHLRNLYIALHIIIWYCHKYQFIDSEPEYNMNGNMYERRKNPKLYYLVVTMIATSFVNCSIISQFYCLFFKVKTDQFGGRSLSQPDENSIDVLEGNGYSYSCSTLSIRPSVNGNMLAFNRILQACIYYFYYLWWCGLCCYINFILRMHQANQFEMQMQK